MRSGTAPFDAAMRCASPTGRCDLTAEHGDLMTEHQDLRVLGRLAAAEQDQPAEDPDHDQVEHTERHNRDLAATYLSGQTAGHSPWVSSEAEHRALGPVTSSQQSHLATLRHTEPGVHETRDAPNSFSRPRGPTTRPAAGTPWAESARYCSGCIRLLLFRLHQVSGIQMCPTGAAPGQPGQEPQTPPLAPT